MGSGFYHLEGSCGCEIRNPCLKGRFWAFTFSNVSMRDMGVGLITWHGRSGSLLCISDCQFSGCNSRDCGACLRADNVPMLEISNVSFVNITTDRPFEGRGGAVFATGKELSVTVNQCVFSECFSWGSMRGGAAEFDVSFGETKLVECQFLKCHVNASLNNDGNITEKKKLEFFGGGGGAFFECFENVWEIYIFACYFANCTSSLRGGALYFDKEDNGIGQVTISSSTFIGCTSLFHHGDDIFWGPGSKRGLKVVNCMSQTTKGKARRVDVWYPFEKGWASLVDEIAYVSASGADSADCGGSEVTSCLTLSYVLSTLLSSTNVSRVILVGERQEKQRSKITLSQEIKIGSINSKTIQPMNVSVEPWGGFDVINCTLSVENVEFDIIDLEGDLFFVKESNGKLFLTNITTRYSGGFGPFVYVFVRFFGCTLNMDSCVINMYSLSNEPIIIDETLPSSLSTRSVTMNNVIVANISTSKVNKAVINIPTFTQLELSNCSFNKLPSMNCTTGGAMRIDIAASGETNIVDSNFSQCSVTSNSLVTQGGGIFMKYNSNGIVKLKGLKFMNNNATVGKDIFVECSSLEDILVDDAFGFALDLAIDERTNSLFGKDSTAHTSDTDLYDLLPPFEEVHISSNGTNFLMCGTDVHPCLTVEYGFGHVEWSFPSGSGGVGALMFGMYGVNSKNKVLEVNGREMAMEGMGRDSSMVSFSSDSIEPGIIISNSTLEIMDVEFVIKEGITNLIEVYSGTELIITGFSALTTTTGVECECTIFMSGGLVSLSSSLFRSIFSHKSVLFISEQMNGDPFQVEISDVLFGSCNSTTMAGGVFVPGSFEGEIIMNSTNLSRILCSNGTKGGAVFVNVTGGTSVKFTNCNFSENALPSTIAYGGGLYMSIMNESGWALEDPEFDLNQAMYGAQLFLFCRSLRRVVNETSVRFVVDNNSTLQISDMMGMDLSGLPDPIDLREVLNPIVPNRCETYLSWDMGKDASTCGDAAAPCRTLHFTTRVLLSSCAPARVVMAGRSVLESAAVLTNMSMQSVSDEHSIVSIWKDEHAFASDTAIAFDGECSVEQVAFQLPVNISSTTKNMLYSRSGAFELSNCTFTLEGQDVIDYCIIGVALGSFCIQKCVISEMILGDNFLRIYSGISESRVFSCNFTDIVTENVSLITYSTLGASSWKSTSTSTEGFTQGIHTNKEIPSISLRFGRNAADKVMLINDTTFTNISQHSASSAVVDLAEISYSSVDIELCNFTDCDSLSSQHGGALFATVNSVAAITMKMAHIRLSYCTTSEVDGKGGGLHLIFEHFSGQNMMGNSDVEFSGFYFDGNKACYGKDLYVEANNPESVMPHIVVTLLEQYDYNDTNWCVFNTSSAQYIDEYTPLLVFRVSKAVADAAGADTKACGKENNPCCTLKHALNRLKPAEDEPPASEGQFYKTELTVDLTSDMNLSESVQLTSTKIDGINAGSGGIVFLTGAGVGAEWIMCAVVAEFSKLKFSFEADADFETKTFIAFEGGRPKSCLTLRSCEVVGRPSAADGAMFMGGALVRAMSGALVVEGCTFNSLRTKNTLFDCTGANVVSVKSSSFRSLAVKLPVFRGGIGGSSVSLAECNFRNVSVVHDEGSASAVPLVAEIADARNFSMQSVTCSECKVEANEGTYAAFSASHFLLENCEFNEKVSSSSNAKKVSSSSTLLTSSFLFTQLLNEDQWFIPEQVCTWNGSMICARSGEGTLKNTTFSNSPYGALSVRESNVNLQEMNFSLNKPKEFGTNTAARRNVLCHSSAIHLDTTAEWERSSDGQREGQPRFISMWFWEDNCTTQAGESLDSCNLFQPFLQSVKSNISEKKMNLSFNGTDFFPCQLGFKVSIVRNGNIWKEETFEMDTIHNETSANGSFDLSFLEQSYTSDEIKLSLTSTANDNGICGSSKIGTTQMLSIGKGFGNDPSDEDGNKESPEGDAEAMKRKATAVTVVCFALTGMFLVLSVLLTLYLLRMANSTKKMAQQLQEKSGPKKKKKKKKKRITISSDGEKEKEKGAILKYEELRNEDSRMLPSASSSVSSSLKYTMTSSPYDTQHFT
eukprot:MONOS_2037.1-p1 / transcript=MONOS_2037.1 / gene=MONOS_2037 / organism=Monocercomonoides_exilis_PA203 / gene_product=unspecified product / transcript_product=unspecified product / location=Mono_scaffold00039:167389-173577(+) / protein_length=2063 / sequence_SO=supercontig / SO=protein_coding / is_pseudo=false